MKLPETFKKVASNLKLAGVKQLSGTKAAQALKTVAPVVVASTTLKQLQQIPGVDFVFDGLSKLWDLTRDIVENIPIIGWLDNATGKLLKPIASALGGYVEEKDRKYFGTAQNDESIWTSTGAEFAPNNIQRPMNPGLSDDIAVINEGEILRLSELIISMPDFYQFRGWEEIIDNIWEDVINGYRRNVSYNRNTLSVYLHNSMMLYVVGKQLERKIGFQKFADVNFPAFRDHWNIKVDHTTNFKDGIAFDAAMDTRFDPSNGEFADTRDAYDLICRKDYTLLLPKNYKKMIDHYFGSVFRLDKDVKNYKLMVPVVNAIPWWVLSGDGSTISVTTLNYDDISYLSYLDMITEFYSKFVTLRSDLNNAVIVVKASETRKALLSEMDQAWFTSYDAYQPTILDDDTFRQALINGYTDPVYTDKFGSNTADKSNFVRLDFIDDNYANDPFTTLVFAGATFTGTSKLFNAKGFRILRQVTKVLATNTTPVYIPHSWTSASGASDIVDNVFKPTKIVKPFYFILTTQFQNVLERVNRDTVAIKASSTTGTDTAPLYYRATVPTTLTGVNIGFGFSAGSEINISMIFGRSTFVNTATLGVVIPIFAYEGGKFVGIVMGVSNNARFYNEHPVLLDDKYAFAVVYNPSEVGSIGNVESAIDVNDLVHVSGMETWIGGIYDLNWSASLSTPYSTPSSYSATLSIKFSKFTGLSVSSFTLQPWMIDTSRRWLMDTYDEEYITYGNYSMEYTYSIDAYGIQHTIDDREHRFKLLPWRAWLFNNLGYSIPIIDGSVTLEFTTLTDISDEADPDNTDELILSDQVKFTIAGNLLKEDYVPFLINTSDVAKTYYYMYTSLIDIESISRNINFKQEDKSKSDELK